MILQFLEQLNTKTIVLASSSPRRQEILNNIGLKFSIVPSTFEENLKEEDFTHPRDYVTATAVGKAEEVRDRLTQQSDESSPLPDLIIGCDTCVTLDGKIYGKPRDNDHATQMLQMWSGRTQDVISGVCLLHRLSPDKAWQKVTFSETTHVTFGVLTLDTIQAYVNTREPRDKAGAYGIQGMGGSLVEGIQGDYYNVMGFPLHHFCKQLLPLLEQL